MSLPKFEMKGSLFESLGSIAADLFDGKDKYTASLRAKFGLCWRATEKKWRNVTSQKSLSRDGLVNRNLALSAILASISPVIFLKISNLLYLLWRDL